MRRKAVKMNATKKALTKKTAKAKANVTTKKAIKKKGKADLLAGSFVIVSQDETEMIFTDGTRVPYSVIMDFSRGLFPSKEKAKETLMTADLGTSLFQIAPAKKYLKYRYSFVEGGVLCKAIVMVHDKTDFASPGKAIAALKKQYKGLVAAAKADVKTAQNTLKRIVADHAKVIKAAGKHA